MLDLYFIPYAKSNSKWIRLLNVRAKVTKFLEENIGINIHDLGLDNGFFRYGTKSTNKRKTKYIGLY